MCFPDSAALPAQAPALHSHRYVDCCWRALNADGRGRRGTAGKHPSPHVQQVEAGFSACHAPLLLTTLSSMLLLDGSTGRLPTVAAAGNAIGVLLRGAEIFGRLKDIGARGLTVAAVLLTKTEVLVLRSARSTISSCTPHHSGLLMKLGCSGWRARLGPWLQAHCVARARRAHLAGQRVDSMRCPTGNG